MKKRIIVATNGSPTSDAALRVAAAIAARQERRVEVLAVLEPLPVLDAGFAPTAGPFESYDGRRSEALRTRVRAQVSAVTGSADSWPVEVRVGHPATEIVRAARERDVVLIVMGIGRHAPADRIFGSETALKVSRRSLVPVLAVVPGADRLPRNAFVGMDFSASSIEAARNAMRFLQAPATLTLVHVSPDVDIPPIALDEWQATYARGVAEAFEKARVALAPPPGITLETVTRQGDAAEALLHLGAQAGMDLIAAGSHGHNFVERLLIGSVATKLLRSAQCSMLLVPAFTTAEDDEFALKMHAVPEAVV
jgi:nucleotide-binding universal stress UspA family protein